MTINTTFNTPKIVISDYSPDRPVSRTSKFVNNTAHIRLDNEVFAIERSADKKQYRILASSTNGQIPTITQVFLDTLDRLLGVAIGEVDIFGLGMNVFADAYTKKA